MAMQRSQIVARKRLPTSSLCLMALPASVIAITSDFLDELDASFPGRVTGLFLHGSLGWGEFFHGSDVDFVAVWDVLPTERDFDGLKDLHELVKGRHPDLTLDGFHTTAADLRSDPDAIDFRPVFYQGEFDPIGRIDINPVTWHELAFKPVIVRGQLPEVRTNLDQLVNFTRTNLDTYWREKIDQIQQAGVDAVGRHNESIVWCGLGSARLHHLLKRHTLTSKSGAGRYVRDELDSRWTLLASECLRLRETPEVPTLYDEPAQRGRDLQNFLTWIIDDGTR